MAYKRSAVISSDKGADEKVQAEFWLRICESAEENSDKFPYDTALDTMPDLKGSSDFATSANDFKADFLEAIQDMEPGEERVTTFVVKVYRANKHEDKPREKKERKFF